VREMCEAYKAHDKRILRGECSPNERHNLCMGFVLSHLTAKYGERTRMQSGTGNIGDLNPSYRGRTVDAILIPVEEESNASRLLRLVDELEGQSAVSLQAIREFALEQKGKGK